MAEPSAPALALVQELRTHRAGAKTVDLSLAPDCYAFQIVSKRSVQVAVRVSHSLPEHSVLVAAVP